MVIFPAIDLRRGQVVRLAQGRDDAATIYDDDPAQTAHRWQREGAEWLHVVNLDAAFGEPSAVNLAALDRILTAVQIPVQYGGGLRDLQSVETAIARGVARSVIGTGALTNPTLVSESVSRLGSERVVVGIDARDGIVATHGWRALSSIPVLDLANQMAERGVTRVVYTDIARDGMLKGIDAEGVARFARETGLRVIASGGVAAARDVDRLREHEREGIEGVIIGQALYSGAVSFKDVNHAG